MRSVLNFLSFLTPVHNNVYNRILMVSKLNANICAYTSFNKTVFVYINLTSCYIYIYIYIYICHQGYLFYLIYLFIYILEFRRFRKICEKRLLLASSCLSVCPYPWINSAPAGQIFL